MILRKLFLLAFLLSFSIAHAQEKRKFTATGLPFIVSSPETSINFGVYGQFSFDLVPQRDSSIRKSQVSIVASRSLKKQNYFSVSYLLFSKDENYFLQGKFATEKTVDRFYGLGNKSNLVVEEFYKEKSQTKNLNYANISYSYITNDITAVKQIKKGVFTGVRTEFFNVSKYAYIADSIKISDTSFKYFNGNALGAGVSFVWDTRKYINNPIKADYLQFSTMSYGFGLDYSFTKIILDYRKYFKVGHNQTFATRFYGASILGSQIPFYTLNKVGGKDLARGYFRGTFTDKNMMVFEVEHRIPFYKNMNSSIWEFWKRIGMTVFLSTSQVANDLQSFSFNMRSTAGVGLRFLLSKDQRTNVRIDYAVGFYPNANGINKRQSGFYININEAF